MAVINLLVLGFLCSWNPTNSAPINKKNFENEIETQVKAKLEGLNITEAMQELKLYKHYVDNNQAIVEHNFRERGMSDGLFGVLDPGFSPPGSRSVGKHLSTMLEVLQLGQVVYEVENSVFGGASCTACKENILISY